jgi:iron complex transport system substrate-binding protein
VTFTDDVGNTVTVNNPQRVVATMGSFAKIWELAGGTLVGVSNDVDTFSGYALSSPDVARVGDFASLDMEKIIALEPDLVIMTGVASGRVGTANQLEFKETLEASGITVAYFVVTTFDDYLRMLNTCCTITGRSDLLASNGEDVQAAINDIISQVPGGEKPRVLLMATFSGGTRVQRADTQTGDMLADLGAVNIADENPSLLSDFSLEAVIESDPDFIFVIPTGFSVEEAERSLEEMTASHPAWSQIDAVKNGHYIILLPDLYLNKPNEKWADAYQELYDYLYTR